MKRSKKKQMSRSNEVREEERAPDPFALGPEDFDKKHSVRVTVYSNWEWWDCVRRELEDAKNAYTDGQHRYTLARAHRRIFLLGVERLEGLDPMFRFPMWSHVPDRHERVVIDLSCEVYARAQRLGMRSDEFVRACMGHGLEAWGLEYRAAQRALSAAKGVWSSDDADLDVEPSEILLRLGEREGPWERAALHRG